MHNRSIWKSIIFPAVNLHPFQNFLASFSVPLWCAQDDKLSRFEYTIHWLPTGFPQKCLPHLLTVPGCSKLQYPVIATAPTLMQTGETINIDIECELPQPQYYVSVETQASGACWACTLSDSGYRGVEITVSWPVSRAGLEVYMSPRWQPRAAHEPLCGSGKKH
ncbi:uncharacterized protein EI90DRAFT_3048047 [Cantharellus anzutake]|uniref:uncharacterized protein n=1 Tax=Cantharellus anzutake TaxID=1750568 RepID=UPI00190585FD|nr:uncharacterized protein EI90DRAFT_3048047 [Cantharellus anzutake]KAF8335358.1 hypothetical protein EI90DRAFT_3048047 [Cantharellus anzutake]